MGTIFMLLGGICYLVSFVCAIIVLIDAFKSAIWKGIVGLLCGLYLLYFGIVEFQNEKKGMILGGWIGLGIVGWVLMMIGGVGSMPAQ